MQKRANGGIIVYIKDNIRQGVKLVKNEIDCVIWIKLDKNYYSTEEEMYICITYVAPENSPIHNLYNLDIFKSVEGFFFSNIMESIFIR